MPEGKEHLLFATYYNILPCTSTTITIILPGKYGLQLQTVSNNYYNAWSCIHSWDELLMPLAVHLQKLDLLSSSTSKYQPREKELCNGQWQRQNWKQDWLFLTLDSKAAGRNWERHSPQQWRMIKDFPLESNEEKWCLTLGRKGVQAGSNSILKCNNLLPYRGKWLMNPQPLLWSLYCGQILPLSNWKFLPRSQFCLTPGAHII